MEYLPGIHSLETVMGPRPLCQYILHQERTILIDTGVTDTPDKLIFPYLQQVGIDPAGIDMAVITHGDIDHFGGNAAVRRAAPKCLLISHKTDRAWASDREVTRRERYQMFEADHGVGYPAETLAWFMELSGPPVPVDLAVSGGELIRIGPDWAVELLHVPGHTPGHLVVWDLQHQALFLGEAALGFGLRDSTGRYFGPPPYYDREAYLSTVQRLSALKPTTMFTSHFGVLAEPAISQFFQESLEYIARVDAALSAALKPAGKRGLTLKELCAAMDKVLGPYDSADELAPVATGHLKGLVQSGKVSIKIKTVPGEPIRWAWVG